MVVAGDRARKEVEASWDTSSDDAVVESMKKLMIKCIGERMSKRRLVRRRELINEALPAAWLFAVAARSALPSKTALMRKSLALAEAVAGAAEGHAETSVGKVAEVCPSVEVGTCLVGGRAADLGEEGSVASFHSTGPRAGLKAVAEGSTVRPSCREAVDSSTAIVRSSKDRSPWVDTQREAAAYSLRLRGFPETHGYDGLPHGDDGGHLSSSVLRS